MEKMEEYEITTKRITHNFYCDECEMFLGKSEEYDDGWYPEIGEFNQKMFVQGINSDPGYWYSIHKNLCKACAAKLNTRIKVALEELGFECE